MTEVLHKHNVLLTAIGVYSVNTKNEETAKIREDIKEKLLSIEYITQIHGFYLNKEKNNIRFDMVVSYDAPDRTEVYDKAVKTVKEMYPGYELNIAMDTDFSEE